MRGPSAASVLTVAFVLASTSLLLPAPAAAQVADSVLQGMVCYQEEYGEPRPMPASGAPEPGPRGDGCYGQGVPGATVKASRQIASGLPADEKVTTADGNGFWALKGLLEGTYTVTITSGATTDHTARVEVRGTTQHDATVALREVLARGRVVDGAGAGVAGAEVLAYACCGEPVRTTTDGEGAFSLRVLGGHRGFEARKPGHQVGSMHLWLDGTKQIEILAPALPPPAAYVRGTVRDQAGAPVEGVRVSTWQSCCYDMPAPTYEGDAAMSSRPHYGGEVFAFTGADGRYELGVYQGYAYITASKEGHASKGFQVEVAQGRDVERDVRLPKFPAKDARVEGRVVDAATGQPVANAYLNIQHPEFGLHTCSQPENAQSGQGSAGSDGMRIMPPYPYWEGCDITLRSDGRFTGTVTPGYAIVSVHHDPYQACARDGRPMTGPCGPEYFPYIRTLRLASGETSQLRIELERRAEPNAIISGYVLDEASSAGLAGARLTFYNQEGVGWGEAVADEHGSYKIGLRAGLHTVTAHAEGHLRWEGVVRIEAGDNDLDIALPEGDDSWGGCCWMYAKEGVAMDSAAASPEPAGRTQGAAAAPMAPPQTQESALASGGGSGTKFADLGGGLGPYDASKRQGALAGSQADAPERKDASMLAPLVTLAALGVALALRRRLA